VLLKVEFCCYLNLTSCSSWTHRTVAFLVSETHFITMFAAKIYYGYIFAVFLVAMCLIRKQVWGKKWILNRINMCTTRNFLPKKNSVSVYTTVLLLLAPQSMMDLGLFFFLLLTVYTSLQALLISEIQDMTNNGRILRILLGGRSY
jgi:hypothetical protein